MDSRIKIICIGAVEDKTGIVSILVLMDSRIKIILVQHKSA